jgi:Domain of unknown function (DUF4118)
VGRGVDVLAVLFPAGALAIALALRGTVDASLPFVAAVTIASWIGGIWPGLLAVLLSSLALAYYFVPPLYSFAVGLPRLPYLIFFLATAVGVSLLSSQRRRARNAPGRARDELGSNGSSGAATSRQLTSWKEIADYLEVNVRTAQRWEQEKGLPVRRFSGERGRVVAIPDQLDHWKATKLTQQSWWSSPSFLRPYAIATSAALVILLSVTLGIHLHSQRLGPPSRLRVEDKELIVADAAGRELWRYGFAEPLAPEAVRARSWLGPLSSPKSVDTLFVDRVNRLANTRLLCFSADGRLRWQFQPGKTVSDGKLQYPAVYLINSFRVVQAAGEGTPKVVVTSNHGWSYPDQVAVLDAAGKMTGEYWHAGHLTTMETVLFGPGGSPWVVLGGVDNGRHRATIVFLDPKNVHGFSAEEDDAFNLRGFAPGTERAIVWFERSCMNELSEQFNYTTDISSIPQGLQVVVRETHDSAYVVYVLDKNLNVTYAEVSSGFRSLHRELELAGRLKHKLTDDEVAKLWKVHVIRRP